MCMCSEDTETTAHYLISCQLYDEILFNTVSSIIQNDVSTFRKHDLCSLLPYGDACFNEIWNSVIFKSTIIFIKDSGHFIRNDCKNLSEKSFWL